MPKRSVRGSHPDILEAIRTSGALSDETQGKLKSVLDNLVKTFA